jgi:hypothetical protein
VTEHISSGHPLHKPRYNAPGFLGRSPHGIRGADKVWFLRQQYVELVDLYGVESNTGNFEEVCPPADYGFSRRESVLGEGDVVGTIFRCLHGHVARGTAEGPYDAFLAKGLTRKFYIILKGIEMDTVTLRFGSAVCENGESKALVFVRDGLQRGRRNNDAGGIARGTGGSCAGQDLVCIQANRSHEEEAGHCHGDRGLLFQ